MPVPSALFNVLFVAGLIIPAAMYIIGVLILMVSLVVRHFRETAVHRHSMEAIAH